MAEFKLKDITKSSGHEGNIWLTRTSIRVISLDEPHVGKTIPYGEKVVLLKYKVASVPIFGKEYVEIYYNGKIYFKMFTGHNGDEASHVFDFFKYNC